MQLQEISNSCCYIFGFDRRELQNTKDKLTKFGGVWKKATISNMTDEENDIYTLDDLMKLQNTTKIEILKMDIEGLSRNI
ncbi:hypothetical protein NECAME_03847 [Necator americanus]|uniref:Methyltransferase FkbM domain-containing protein n=1 Tax=Necator americanus TaxID=51031 RepID=W2T0N3_NECAM|nr:hypothetical protein NECAME_03847 [Necator americanus]ETN75124.1 hypothetical protein NECAME_03847 [Necator americanus]